MSDNENLNNNEETSKVKLSSHSTKKNKQLIEDTFNLYATQKVELEESDGEVTHGRKSQYSISASEKKAVPETIIEEPVLTPEPEPVVVKTSPPPVQKKPIVEKILHKEIKSVENFNPELQEYVKKAMTSEKKAEVDKIMKEMVKQEEEFFTNEQSVLGSLKKADKETLTKKMEEMKVAKEITEVNVSAIISCIDNIRTKKSK